MAVKKKPTKAPPPPEKKQRPVETAADRRNFLRRKAGWPVRE